MRPEGPSEAEVDYLIKEKKYIKVMPEVIEAEKHFQMRAPVFRASEPNKPTGLVLIATAKKSPPGIPRPFPSAALELAGRFRVRGLNYSIRHDSPGGPIVTKWHEHTWTDEHEDEVVVKATPSPRDVSIRGMFNWGLKKWNIKVGEPRARGQRHGKK